jgi:hypothetical protein
VGKVSIRTAKKTKNSSFRHVPRQNREAYMYTDWSSALDSSEALPTISKLLPPGWWTLTVVAGEEEEPMSVPIGAKNEERQQTHITKAIENRPNLPGLLLLSMDFLSRTKLTSETSLVVLASLS